MEDGVTPVLVFDIETIPDVAGLRKLGTFETGMSDADANKAMKAATIG